ncbi:MAG: aminotransferase class III-fold pyridoxal phosphate-dependent enzyme [Bacteroidota bacterium]
MSTAPTSSALIEQAQSWLQHYYNLDGEVHSLPGEVDYNFLVTVANQKQYTLKVSRPGTDQQELDFQIAILEHLRSKDLPFAVPQLVVTKEGNLVEEAKGADGQQHYLRLQSWVSGRMLDEVRPRSAGLLQNWGATTAELNLALRSFDHPYAHRAYKWDPSRTLESRPHGQWFSEEQKQIADFFWARIETEVQPLLPTFRKGVNYNDAHEQNLLVNSNTANPQISGVIDFGDALHTQTINELAIACAYAIMGLPDPLTAACQVVQGFHQIAPLEKQEVAVLYDMIAARLLITVATAADNLRAEPENQYLQVSAQPAWEALAKWRDYSPILAHYRLRAACGWEAVPARAHFEKWISQQPSIHPVMPLAGKKIVPLDLSVSSLDLGNNDRFLDIDPFCRTIDELLYSASADFGVGGYAEVRPFYTTDAYQVRGNEGAQWRTVHLGLDVWGAAHTPVYAPLAGTVYSVADNAGERDYGPTIILEHSISKELVFYTLYGHLSRDSVTHLTKGQAVTAGEVIAAVGPAPENGNWPPHLHFQILLDLLGEQQDFPGVCYPAERTTWLSLCPDPALLFPELPKLPEDSWEQDAILQKRSQFLGRSLSISYRKPLHMVRGFGAYLYDQNARRYLDTVNNVAHVGHEHPLVVKAAQRQLAVLNTNTRYLHENVVRFAEELVQTLPPELSVVHFVNSGSEANELALRMAKNYSGQQDIIALEIGYHGNTGACIDVSSYKFDGKGGSGAPPHTHIVPMPNLYRGQFRDPATAGDAYAKTVGEALKQLQQEGRGPAAFLAESILSCGGQIVLPEGYLKAIYQQVRAAGGLCIADEVQVGFGRVGSHFWGFELQGVVPDIVTMGKPIGNGHPLAAVVTTPKVAEAFANGMEFFNTFGGNPVSAAIGRAVLKVIQEEDLQVNAQQVGQYLRQGLLELQTRHPIIGDVRGPGFFQGIELVKDQTTLEPAAAEASYLANRMRQRGVLMSTDGPLYNVLKIKPPICFGQTQADFLLENLDLVLQEDMFQL